MPGSLHGFNGPEFVSRFAEDSGLWQAPPQTAKKMSAPAIVQSLSTGATLPTAALANKQRPPKKNPVLKRQRLRGGGGAGLFFTVLNVVLNNN